MASRVARVSWHDVGNVEEPGRSMFRFGWVTITAEDLATWSHFPNATLALYEVRGETANQFKLGAFDVGSGLGYRSTTESNNTAENLNLAITEAEFRYCA